ncbi:MAG: RNA polymerase sigma-70 factor [Saprospiraceae bacterium]|nr:RNA polymerase sigma-70 factor [Saprospiraceae bacterium]
MIHSPSDQELLDRLKQDDDEAFRAIYKRYGKKCYGLALQKIRLKEVAEEITQNIFISLWERRHSLSIQNLDIYLSIAIKYQTLNFLDSQLTREKFALSLPPQYSEDSAENTVENTIFLKELMSALEKAVSELPEKTQMVYRLSRFDNLSGREIAERIGLSEKSVEYHISQSLRFLRERLKDFLAVGILLNLI